MPWNKQVVKVTKERRTYVLGEFLGKYHGEIDELKKKNLSSEEYYDLTIYEASISVNDRANIRKHSEGPFPGFNVEDNFPGKLPDPLPCDITLGNEKQVYKLNLHEPRFQKESIELFDHQLEDSEVFGTIKAVITGYIRDEIEVNEEVNLWGEEDGTVSHQSNEEPAETILEKTGNEENLSGYKREQYYSADRRQTNWSNWKYQAQNAANGCLPLVFQVIGICLLILFIFIVGIRILVIPAIWLGIILLTALPSRVLSWIFSLIGLMLLLAFIYTIAIKSDFGTAKRRIYKTSQDGSGETSDRRVYDNSTIDSIKSESQDNINKDEFIVNHRIWNDYRGNTYEGDLKVLLSDFNRCYSYRSNYTPVALNYVNPYDELLFKLSSFDSSGLRFVYSMFDSIGRANLLTRTQFAEMIVSCVQDIPYTLVLDQACSSDLYRDGFIQQYLEAGNACEGYTKFGLFSPIEFVGNLKGDCDTRTLLLFSILKHYNYGVAILSSDFYKHSILAIDLPYMGSYKQIAGARFYAWETTFANFKPGDLPSEIGDMSLWRISLTNKKQHY